jgi:adenylate cyclase
LSQRLRLLAGLVLFVYVTTHLFNHALGLVSLQAAEEGRLWFTAFWRHPFGTLLLYGSLITHFTLVLWKIYQRRHLRLPGWEIIRLLLGLSIPFFLLQHAFATRGLHELTGIDDTYTRQMLVYGVLNPPRGAQQLVLLTVAWLHGCMGIHYWLRVKPWHALTVPVLRLLGFVVPLLALGGFLDMRKELLGLASDAEWLARAYVTSRPDEAALIGDLQEAAIGVYLAAVGLVFAARQARTMWQRRRHGVVRVTYPDGRRVPIIAGTTVLEASRAAGIPHASLCGGRGRCSTCRTRIGAGLETLPRPSADEARVLLRIGAPANVRLACQLRPVADLEVFPLLPPVGALPTNPLRPGYAQGVEQELAILFADLRDYSRFAEQRLPYDVVFVLNQYFAGMGEAIEGCGGCVDKFIGDGVMALFGLSGGPRRGCRQALEAAVAMAAALEQLNRALAAELREPLRIGIGIHVGQVIVGELGHGQARTLTAVGDVVNIASRLEELTKEYGGQLIVSEELANLAGVDLGQFPSHEVAVRGRTKPLTVHVVSAALDLQPVLASSADSLPGQRTDL